MRIGALEAEPLALAPAAALLLLLLQAARTLTESATALNAIAFLVITFLENQGSSALTPGSSFLYRSGFFGIEPVRYVGVLTFEGYTGRLRLLRDERGEIYVTVTPAHESLDELVNQRCDRHRDLAFACGCQPKVEI